MSAVLMVIGDICCEQPFQMGFVERDHVIKQIVPAALDPSLGHAVLPWTLNRGTDRLHLQRADRRSNFEAELGITIKDQESWTSYNGKCFSKLLYHPSARRMARHIEVRDLSSVVTDHEKAVEQTKSYRRDREEIHRRNRLPMVSQEDKPALCWLGISRRASHPARDRSLGYIESEHQYLAMN